MQAHGEYIMQYHNNAARQDSPISSAPNRWLTQFLESRVFLRLPAKNLQALITQFEEVHVQAGRTVVTPNTQADYYYIIKHGMLDMYDTNDHIAMLCEGEGFGEEVLSDNRQYALKVIATTDCVLVRLTREDFDQLLVTPILQTLSSSDYTSNKNLIDTNPDNLHENLGAQHIPFPCLRTKITTLNKKSDYLITHQDAGLRKASAFTLSQLGYSVTVIEGTLNNIANSTNVTELNPTVNEELDPNLLAELEALDAQIKSLEDLETNIGEKRPQQEKPPRNTSIECIESDEEQLWTPIPLSTQMNSDQLRVLKTQEEATPLVRNNPKNQNASSSIETDSWLADNYVWEKVLGFDGTDEVDELLQEEHKKTTESLAQANLNDTFPLNLTPVDTPKESKQVNIHKRTASKRHSKALYIITSVLALSLIAWPFVMPNTWNHYYDKITSYMTSAEITQKTIGIEPSITLTTESHSDQISPAHQDMAALALQKQLAIESAKTQARAEFARKLAAIPIEHEQQP